MSIWMDIHKKSNGDMHTKEENVGRYITTDEMPADEMHKKINEMMREGIVHFVYQKKDIRDKYGVKKKDGEIRDAWGTKYMEIIDKIPHGGDSIAKKAGYTPYFDCEQRDWRCYLDARLIGFYNVIYGYSEFEKLSKAK